MNRQAVKKSGSAPLFCLFRFLQRIFADPALRQIVSLPAARNRGRVENGEFFLRMCLVRPDAVFRFPICPAILFISLKLAM